MRRMKAKGVSRWRGMAFLLFLCLLMGFPLLMTVTVSLETMPEIQYNIKLVSKQFQ